MKKYILALFIVFSITMVAHGQVTIGSGVKPVSGALLDLKEHEPDENNVTASGGLLLPRVK